MLSDPHRPLVEMFDVADGVVALLLTVDAATVTVDVAPAVAPMEEEKTLLEAGAYVDMTMLVLNGTVGRALFRFSTQTRSYSEYKSGSSAEVMLQ